MCGIAGFIAVDGTPVHPGLLQRMNDRLAHRGPDGEGFLLATPERGRFRHKFMARANGMGSTRVSVGLAHRRLAILDLSDRGQQPMSTPDGRLWVVFNGEIYNHRELRSALERDGVRFVSRTDTEVLLHAYGRWGEGVLEHLAGMFAFAIWDSAHGKLFCARDRLGIKPFYYATPKGLFLFGSEIKALLACDAVDPVPDHAAVLEFLVHSNCDYAERTMFRNVKALPAAHALTVDVHTGKMSTWRYWTLEAAEPAPDRDGDEARIEQLKELLVDTTRKHLVSDVRAGSCLSGGLDSSTVVSLIGQLRRDQPESATALGDRFYTFTSCFEHRQFDEREYALAVADAAGATPQLVFPSPDDFWADFARMAWHQDMPFGGFSYYSQWRVMRAAHESGIKVLLDGQGGDEVFGGYAKFRYAYLASLARSGRLPTLLTELAATFRQGDRYVLDLRNGYRYLPRRLRSTLKVDSLLQRVLRADWARTLSGESTPATRWWRYVSRPRNGHAWSVCQQVQVDDLLIDTLPQLLRMEDRSSMAFSLEARVPLLDHRLVEYGVRLPDRLKIRHGWSKFAVRQAMRDVMPETVRARKTKLGFAAPDRVWLLSGLREEVKDLLGEDMRCRGYVDVPALRQWYGSPEAEQANTESYLGLFRVLSLEMWMRAYRL